MNTDNTQDINEPSPASAGSQAVAYEIHWKGQDGKYLAKPYLVFANERPSEHWEPAPRCLPLYRSPTLTDEERVAIERLCEAVTEYSDIDRKESGCHADDDMAAVAVARGLMKRMV